MRADSDDFQVGWIGNGNYLNRYGALSTGVAGLGNWRHRVFEMARARGGRFKKVRRARIFSHMSGMRADSDDFQTGWISNGNYLKKYGDISTGLGQFEEHRERRLKAFASLPREGQRHVGMALEDPRTSPIVEDLLDSSNPGEAMMKQVESDLAESVLSTGKPIVFKQIASTLGSRLKAAENAVMNAMPYTNTPEGDVAIFIAQFSDDIEGDLASYYELVALAGAFEDFPAEGPSSEDLVAQWTAEPAGLGELGGLWKSFKNVIKKVGKVLNPVNQVKAVVHFVADHKKLLKNIAIAVAIAAAVVVTAGVVAGALAPAAATGSTIASGIATGAVVPTTIGTAAAGSGILSTVGTVALQSAVPMFVGPALSGGGGGGGEMITDYSQYASVPTDAASGVITDYSQYAAPAPAPSSDYVVGSGIDAGKAPAGSDYVVGSGLDAGSKPSPIDMKTVANTATQIYKLSFGNPAAAQQAKGDLVSYLVGQGMSQAGASDAVAQMLAQAAKSYGGPPMTTTVTMPGGGYAPQYYPGYGPPAPPPASVAEAGMFGPIPSWVPLAGIGLLLVSGAMGGGISIEHEPRRRASKGKGRRRAS